MKKFAVIVLVLILSLMFTSAFATEVTFDMEGVTDMEGNAMYIVLEDHTIVDPDGNPVEGVPFLTLTIDDEALTFEMRNENEDDAISGTVEVLESTEEQVTVQLTSETEVSFTAVYTAEDITVIDQMNNMMVVFVPEEVA